MRQQPPGWLAPVRGSVLAALVTLLTATGHVVGGGTLVGLSPLAVLVPLLATVLVALAERCRGVVTTCLALGAGQLGLHYLLVVLTAHGHQAAGALAPTFSVTTMAAAHAVATLATAVVVTHADAAVTALVAALHRLRLRRPPVRTVDVAPPARPIPDAAVPLLASLALVAAHARRGLRSAADNPLLGNPRPAPSRRRSLSESAPMNSSIRRSAVRGAVVAAVAAVTALVGAGPAFAHVTAQPGTAAQGGFTVVSLRVPNESDTAGTVKLEVAMPLDHPVTSVRTTPIPGWTAAVAKTTLNPPVQVNGNAVTEAVKSVTWSAAAGTKIGPGEYLDFPLSLGPLPTGIDELALPATQTYDNGEVVAWDQPSTNGAEPEHPAPTVHLTPAAAGDPMAMGGHSDDAAAAGAAPEAPAHTADTTARWLAGGGLLVGALGVGLAAGAVLRSRRPSA